MHGNFLLQQAPLPGECNMYAVQKGIVSYQELIEPSKPAREHVTFAYRSINGKHGGRMLKVVLPVIGLIRDV